MITVEIYIFLAAVVAAAFIYIFLDLDNRLYGNLFAAAFGLFFLPWLAKITNRKITHMVGLAVGGMSLISLYFLTDPHQMIYSMIGIGLAWASILSMPYAILTGSLPQSKMGVYMGIFNFFIVIPQILAATLLGFMVKSLFNDQSIFALIAGGISMIIAALSVLFVEDIKDKKTEVQYLSKKNQQKENDCNKMK